MNDVLEALRRARVFGIVREATRERGRAVAEAAIEGGVRALEVSLVSAEAELLIKDLVGAYGSAVLIGAGTVLTPDELDRAVDAEARYCVSPSLSAEVQRRSAEIGLPCFPGVLTPTEVAAAAALGAQAVKIFPVGALGPSYLRDLRGPFPSVPLLAVGGMDLDKARLAIADGAHAVGVGSPLFRCPAGLRAGSAEHLAHIRTIAARFTEAVSDAK
ncbi:bifunctional 4-hydroxy-2-oxoglutarate aldolase/2-dehydro-3-deoxy-phosphogluconate aldolase [Microbacterium pseudoresistens]|uniref:2-dehydro-3-deoxyphosphogluconate aldolase/(4S)-4-hydroxy-2-oxoglutarate aldolase n=1 Tax=Microbacterium pseudoresistens TaxID=640634 RepID=A0A7Y9EV80_9MICO|nr:bifunctional 4-hydroxy-2-oxoglutarate aldolase/2-dehydro-3-deoxy-phosphogluconate aldolase [Microbacterium pseudoresistens]NYD54406.1 2-dehydro-3-deoxyphosphogluconate aldolase/(4S)-4-hydroxy-2-oxoglutarate aldolase [Microbacterium pseudoresistens]